MDNLIDTQRIEELVQTVYTDLVHNERVLDIEQRLEPIEIDILELIGIREALEEHI